MEYHFVFDVSASRPGPKHKDGHGCSTKRAALLCLRTTLVVPVSHGPACSPTSHSRSFSGLTSVKEFLFAGFPGTPERLQRRQHCTQDERDEC